MPVKVREWIAPAPASPDVVGGEIGALILSFIRTGVPSGFSGLYVQFFNGRIIILSLIRHRWSQARYR